MTNSTSIGASPKDRIPIVNAVNDVLAFLRIATEKEFKIIYDSPRNSDVSTMILDISKITELTKIEFTSLKDGIKLFYNKLNKQN